MIFISLLSSVFACLVCFTDTGGKIGGLIMHPFLYFSNLVCAVFNYYVCKTDQIRAALEPKLMF